MAVFGTTVFGTTEFGMAVFGTTEFGTAEFGTIGKKVVVPEPIEARKVPIEHVSDALGLAALVDSGATDADRVVAVIGKTEGNWGVNDYTHIIADRAFRELLVAKGTRTADEVKQVPIVGSGGTDGVLFPHAMDFATVAANSAPRTDEPRLTVGFAMSERHE
jgi:cyanuric acid amidohydrolase